jgi:hypothetical protein
MRESAKTNKTHLPKDTYQDWLKTQEKGPVAKGRGDVVTENSFEAWMARRVEERAGRASAKAGRKKAPT